MHSPPIEEKLHAHIFVSGTVQGVGYRYATWQQAKHLGISGWVRNLPDKRVEAVFEGNKADVEQMICWCRQGPPGAVVENVEVEYKKPEELRQFQIKR